MGKWEKKQLEGKGNGSLNGYSVELEGLGGLKQKKNNQRKEKRLKTIGR